LAQIYFITPQKFQRTPKKSIIKELILLIMSKIK